MIRGSDVSGTAETLAMFSVATVFLLLASLVAAAGFAVVAQRRLRQLGMLAAVGATEKHLRLVLLTNGAVVGTIAAVIGTIAGLGLWLVFAPTLESAVDHRIDRLSLPWGLIAMAGLLAIAGAIAAAWWPGRTVARLPVLLALSGRPPKPRPARHSAIAAAALIVVGIGCLALSDRETELLIVAGLLATILGSLLLGPLAIRTFSAVAGRVSIAPRLALRDLARYQARSGAALAAVTLSLGIAATVVVIASAEEAKQASEPASLSDRQIRVYLGPSEDRTLTPVDAPAQLDRLAAGARQVAAQLDGATVIPLRKAREPGAAPGRFPGGDTRFIPAVELTRPFRSPEGGKSYRIQSQTLRRHACGARVPRNRPRHDRSGHRLPRRPQRHGQGPGHPELHEPHGDPPSRTSRRSIPAGICSAPTAAGTRRTSSRPMVFAAMAGSRFRPAGSSSRAGP